MPALLKAFLKQVMHPDVAFFYPVSGKSGCAKTLLEGRSARVVVTVGVPALFYRLWYLGHSLAVTRRNNLNFVGISPVRETWFGLVEGVGDDARKRWIASMHTLGAKAN